MSILDSILDNVVRSGGEVEIISENHDLNAINVGEVSSSKPSDGLRQQIDSLKGGNGGWDALEYGISREARIAELEAAYSKAVAFEFTPEGMEQARQEAERVQNQMRQRAIARASLDVTNGRVSTFNVGGSWHGLGTSVREAVDSEQAIRLANLDRTVTKQLMTYRDADDKLRYADDVYALYYQDTGKYLGHVGNRYQVIQNRQAFDFLDGVIGEYGACYESAGAIYGGKKIWLLAHFPQQAFSVNGTDKTEPYVLFTNSHGGEAAWCFPTAERVVCANTFRTASFGRHKGICIRHVGSLQNKMAAAQKVLGLSVKSFETYKESAEQMTQTPIVERVYFGSVLDEVIKFTEAEMALRNGNALEAAIIATEAEKELASKSLDSKLKRRGELLDAMLDAYENETNGTAGMRGTAWAGFNAATYVANHVKLGKEREKNRKEKRFESIVDGDRDDISQAAFKVAMASAN